MIWSDPRQRASSIHAFRSVPSSESAPLRILMYSPPSCRREDGRPPQLQGSSTPQCRFSCESIFAHFVQNLKKPSMYTGPLALPDPAGPPPVVSLEMCEALLPHMYLLPVQIWELSTPIADWNGVVSARRSFRPPANWEISHQTAFNAWLEA